MKMMKSILALFLVLLAGSANAQWENLPQTGELKVAADYQRTEPQVVAAAEWLSGHALDAEPALRRKLNQFVLNWVNGSPTVNVELNPTIFDFEKKNPGLLSVFMAGCARYVLQNNYSKDMRAKHKAALGDVVKAYRLTTNANRDKKMEKLMKAMDEGELDQWLSANLKVGERG
jgi:hypothetical protein